jgi:hypothetical protein
MERGLSSLLKLLLIVPLLSVRTAGAQGNPPTPAPPELKLAFEKSAVVASGLPPGGQVVWFGIARELSQHTAKIVRREITTCRSSRSGWPWISPAGPRRSPPEGYPLRRIELPGQNVGHGGAKPDWVEDDRGYVDVMVVRPGQGAWSATVGDGGANDDDGAYDGRLVAALDRMRGVGASPLSAPEHFSPRDVVVVIDANRMEVGLRQLVEVQP